MITQSKANSGVDTVLCDNVTIVIYVTPNRSQMMQMMQMSN